jgi:hypothetical protein
MSEIADSPPGPDLPPSAGWPAQDLAAEEQWDVKASGNRRRPTRAEQAVPWLIGLVLALSGMLLVLLAVVFSSTDGLLPAYGSPSPEPTMARTPEPLPSLTPEPTPGPTVSGEPTPSPAPTPAFAPLEIIFKQRTSAAGPAHLFRHDFAGQAAPEALLRDDRGVDHYAWAPDGLRGIALVDGNPIHVDAANAGADVGDGFDGVAFASDSITAYAVRATLAGVNDRAELLRVDVATGAVASLAAWTYPHPVTFQESAVQEAQFADDGGLNRVYVLDDGRVVVWILGAPATYTYDPATGVAGATDRLPVLWSPNGHMRVEPTESGGSTQLTVRGLADEVRGAIGVSGYVSHLRWSSLSNQIVFTISATASGGAVTQDLYLWDLKTGSPPVRLTQDLRSSGGEFRGVESRWKP